MSEAEADKTVNIRELSQSERFELASRLLKCAAMQEKDRRNWVVKLLPFTIVVRIEQTDTPLVHILEMVNTCTNYSNGLEALVEAVYKLEGNTPAWREVEAYLKPMAQDGWVIALGVTPIGTGGFQSRAARLRVCPTPPNAPEQFGGRAGPLAALKQQLREGRLTAITALHGLGGIGKTTLARQLSHELFYNEKIFRAALWATIGQKAQPLPLLLGWAYQVDEAFDPGNQSLGEIADRVRMLLEDLIREKCEECEPAPARTLVVLDDVWESSFEAVKLLRRACPGEATVLVTTRNEKVAIGLGAQRVALDRMRGVEGVEMLQAYLPTADPTKLLALVQELGGHPLALELAAKRAQEETRVDRALDCQLKQYQAGLAAGTDFRALQFESAHEPEKELAVVLSYSYTDLKAEEQTRFRALGVLAHDKSFDTAMLSALWEMDEDAAAEQANRLRLLSLLELDNEATGLYGKDRDWYGQHPLLQAYARALLRALPAKQAEARRRYEDFVIEITEKFFDLPPEEWTQLTPYLPHIELVGGGLVAQWKEQPEPNEEWLRRAQLFALNTSRYLSRRREVQQPEWLDMGLAVSRRLQDQKEEARFLNVLGLAADALGDKTKALAYYEQALPLMRAVGDRSGEATTLSNIGAVYSALGDKTKALDYYEQVLPILRAVGDRSGEAVTCFNIGMVYANWGQLEKVIEYVAQCVKLDEQIRHPNLESDRATLAQLRAMLTQSEAAPPNTLPQEDIEAMVNNTIAVMTFAADGLAEWQDRLEQFRDMVVDKGRGWEIEVEFTEALLAVLDGREVILPQGHPYQVYLDQVWAGIRQV